MNKERKKLNPSTMLMPVPAVLVSCHSAQAERPNLITLAWAGVVNSEPPMLSISIRRNRHSHPMVKQSGEFVVNLVSKSLLDVTDYCGVASGRDVDKFERCQLTPSPMEGMVFAPAVLESPISLGCQVRHVLDLGTHDMFIGEVISIEADPNIFNENGKMIVERAELIAYANGRYFTLDEVIANHGFAAKRF